MEDVLQRLFDWTEKNYLHLEQLSEFVFSVPEVGKFLLILPFKGKVLKKGLLLNLTLEDWQRFDQENPDYFLFEFGKRWYYCKPKEVVDEFNENSHYGSFVVDRGDNEIAISDIGFKVSFEDFKYLGVPQLSIDLPFVHLGVHSEYELLNGSGKSTLWCKKAKFLGHKAIGICDKDTLAGTMAFQLACEKSQIQPIIGETITVAHNFDKTKEHQVTYEVKLYVMSNVGWKNLLNISNKLNTEYNRFIPESELFNCSEGLLLVFPKDSLLNNHLDDKKEFIRILQRYKKHFKNIYYQIDTVEFYDDKADMLNLNNIKTYLKYYKSLIKPVLINDSYYVDQEMFMLKEYLNKIEGKATKYSEDEHFKNLDEVHSSFGSMFKSEDNWFDLLIEMCANTIEIADLCKFTIEVGKPKLPKYEFTDGRTSDEMFYDLIQQGVIEKLVNRDNITGDELDIYINRIETECNVIIPAMLSDYFLILWDVIKHTKEQGMIVGTGRGSAAGSLICYVLDITDIDPIKYNLLFERFLNETRVSPILMYDIYLEDGKKVSFKAGTKFKTKKGKEILVEDLKEDDDIDITSVMT